MHFHAKKRCSSRYRHDPTGVERLWTTWHDLRSKLSRVRQCFVYQRTRTRARALAEVPGGVIYFIMTCTGAGLRPRTKVVLFAVVPYNARVRATPCQTLSLINEPRQKDCAWDLISTFYTQAAQFCVFRLLFFNSSGHSSTVYRSSRRDNNINGVFLIKSNIPVESSPS